MYNNNLKKFIGFNSEVFATLKYLLTLAFGKLIQISLYKFKL